MQVEDTGMVTSVFGRASFVCPSEDKECTATEDGVVGADH